MENPGLERFSSPRDETPENYIKVSYRRTAGPPQNLVRPQTMGMDPPVNPVQPLDVTRRDNIQTAPPATGVPSPDPVSSANGAPASISPAAEQARIVRQKQPGGGSSQENPAYDRAHNGPGGVEDKVWQRRNAALSHPLHQAGYDRNRGEFLYDLDHPNYPFSGDRTSDYPPSYISETAQPMFQVKDAHPYHGVGIPGGDDTLPHGDESFGGDVYSEDADLRKKRDALRHTSMANDWGVAERTPGRFEFQDSDPDAKRFSSHVQRLGDGRYGWMSRENAPGGRVFARGVTDDMLDAMGRAEQSHGQMKSHPEFAVKPGGYRGRRRRQAHHNPTEDMHDVMAVQGNDGNWDYSPYMHGMFNGMELMRSIHDRDEPEFRDAPDTYREDKSKDIPKDAEWAQPQPGKTATWRPAKPGEIPGQVEPDDAPAVEPRLAGSHLASEESDSEFWGRQPDVADFSDPDFGDVNSSAYEHEPACETCYLKYGTGWQGVAGHDRMVAGDHEFKPFLKHQNERFSALHKRAEEDDYIHWPGDDGDAFSSVPSDDEWGQHGLEEHERPQGVDIGEHEKLVNHGFRYDMDARHPSYHRSIPRDMPDGTWATENHTIERNPRVERGDIDQGTGGRSAITFPWSHSYTAAGDTDEDILHRGHNSFAGALGASNVLSLKGPEHSEGKKALEGYEKW
jgi:hypothetical protein